MKLADMTKDERSLLLFLETCVVDQGGLVDTRHMNDADQKIVDVWKACGWVDYGRVRFGDLERLQTGKHQMTHWIELTDEMFRLAHEERRARSTRMSEARTWKKTKEKNEA